MSAGISEADLARISEAIAAAESSTAGEIYVVVARASDDFPFVPVLWAAISALLLPWPLHLLTDLSSSTVLLMQAGFFVLASLVLSHPRLRPYVVPAAIAADATRKNAQAQFMAHGVHLTERRTGVLIYVALAERRVEIVADAGINDRVDPSNWAELAQEVSAAARDDRLPNGIIGAVQKAGALLALHFPPPQADRNELSDRVVEI